VVDHYAGSEKLMRKALPSGRAWADLRHHLRLRGWRPAGNEAAHRQLCAAIINDRDNLHGRIGVRIHDATHAHWRADMEYLVGEAGAGLAFITLPKARSCDDLRVQIDLLADCEARAGLARRIPVHVH
jgi:citrate lyase subunit beta/citryl-CoA lyase